MSPGFPFVSADPSAKDDGGLTAQQLGLAKLRGVREWLANNVGLAPSREEGAEPIPKMIVFAHHIEVLDRIQVTIERRSLRSRHLQGLRCILRVQQMLGGFWIV